jgi:uncharacterized protein (TIGR01244 family)
MNMVKLTDTVAVSQQITPGEVADIAAAGYRVLINNRPDGEEAGQPANADIAAAAEASGLEYYYMPITGLNFPGPDFDKMCELMADSEKPVLAFCRTGTRCTNLWVASQAGEARDAAFRSARQLGYDLSLVARQT